MVSRQYHFTRKAIDDLDEILNYFTNDLNNFSNAKMFYENIFKTIDRLCLFPKSCPIVKNKWIKINYVRQAVIDDYLLFLVS